MDFGPVNLSVDLEERLAGDDQGLEDEDWLGREIDNEPDERATNGLIAIQAHHALQEIFREDEAAEHERVEQERQRSVVSTP